MLAVKTEVRSRQADVKKAGGDVAAVKKVEVTVDHSGPGWMAVSFEKDGQVFAGMMLQANRTGSMPAFLNSEQLTDWKKRLAREQGSENVAVDEGTSMAADRTTTTLDRSRIRSVRLRPTIGRFICAKCRTPGGSVAEHASKRKSELLSSPVRAGLIAKKPKLDVRRKSPQMTPIVEMRTSNGFIFRPVGMGQKQQNLQQQSSQQQQPVLQKMVVKTASSTGGAPSVQKVLVRRPIVKISSPITVTPTYRQQPAVAQAAAATAASGGDSQSTVPKIRIVMPNRGNASTPLVATTTAASAVTNTPTCATGTAVIKTGAPIFSESMTVMTSPTDPKPLSSCPKTPPIRIKLGGLNFRQMLTGSSSAPSVPGEGIKARQVIRIQSVGRPQSSTTTPTIGRLAATKSRVIPQVRRVIDTNLEAEESSEPVEAFEPSAEQNPLGLRTGDVVWAKMPGEPFWPAQIYSFNPGGEACVLWLGSTLHGFVTISTLEPFAKLFAKRYNPKRTERGYQKAVVDAIVKNRQNTSDTTYYEQKLSASAWKQLSGGKVPKDQMIGRRSKKGKKKKVVGKAAATAAAAVAVDVPAAPAEAEATSALPTNRRAKAVPQHILPQSAEVSSSGVDDEPAEAPPTPDDDDGDDDDEPVDAPPTPEEDDDVDDNRSEENASAGCSSQPAAADDGDSNESAPDASTLQPDDSQHDQNENEQDNHSNGHFLGPLAGGIEMVDDEDDVTEDSSPPFDAIDSVISELQEMNEMFV